jgi:hypothetical protein
MVVGFDCRYDVLVSICFLGKFSGEHIFLSIELSHRLQQAYLSPSVSMFPISIK